MRRKNSFFQDEQNMRFSVVGSYEVKKVFGTSSETKQIVIT